MQRNLDFTSLLYRILIIPSHLRQHYLLPKFSILIATAKHQIHKIGQTFLYRVLHILTGQLFQLPLEKFLLVLLLPRFLPLWGVLSQLLAFFLPEAPLKY